VGEIPEAIASLSDRGLVRMCREVFADGMDRPLRIRVPFGGAWERQPSAPDRSVPVRGRRSAACGPVCVSGRACSLIELRSADLLAGAPEDAWLRIWAEALVLALLTNRPLPVVPAPLRTRWAALDQRLRECLLATAVDRSLRGRAVGVRAFYDPQALSAAAAATALTLLDGGKGAGLPPGSEWVIPQLQWLHEVERVCPLNGGPPDATSQFAFTGSISLARCRAYSFDSIPFTGIFANRGSAL